MDAGANEPDGEAEIAPSPRPRRRVVAIGVGVAALLVGIVWSERGDIADHEIGTILRQKGIPAKWHVASIGLSRQIFTDVVLGDPAHPDLTIDRVETTTGLQGGVPGLNNVTLVNPRLHGVLRGGRLSFGSLDKLIYGPSTAPFRLPELALRIDNGRGEIAGDAGVIGLGLTGAGPLRDGFAGALVAVAHRLDLGGCHAGDVKLAGRIGVSGERPRLTGPLHMADVGCAGVQLADVTLPLDLRAQAALDGGDGHVGVAARGLSLGAARAAAMHGSADVTLHGRAITARYTGSLHGVHGAELIATTLSGEGLLRTDTAFAHIAAEGTLGGTGVAPDAAAWRMLDQARRATFQTPAGPLQGRIIDVLAPEPPVHCTSGMTRLLAALA